MTASRRVPPPLLPYTQWGRLPPHYPGPGLPPPGWSEITVPLRLPELSAHPAPPRRWWRQPAVLAAALAVATAACVLLLLLL